MEANLVPRCLSGGSTAVNDQLQNKRTVSYPYALHPRPARFVGYFNCLTEKSHRTPIARTNGSKRKPE
jgi:hypothetical protein